MIDHTAIQHNDAIRAEITEKVAQWEAENGPVETQPIRCDDKKLPYRISCPEKREAGRSMARSKLVAKRMEARQANAERIGAMLKLGVSVRIIAERIGIKERSVRRIIAEDGIKP